MIVGKKDIKDYFIKQGKRYFAIYRKGDESSGNPICRNEKPENSDADAESALGDFEDWLNLLQTGDYVLIVNNAEKVSERGGSRVAFRIPLNESLQSRVGDIQPTVPAVQGIGGTYSMEDVLAKAQVMAQEEFKKLKALDDAEKLKIERDDLKKRAEDAEKKLEDPWNKFIGALAPHTDKIVNGFFPAEKYVAPVVGMTPLTLATTKISGIEPHGRIIDNDEATEQTQKIFEDFVDALQIARSEDWLPILVRLTTVIKEDPEKFNTALKFL